MKKSVLLMKIRKAQKPTNKNYDRHSEKKIELSTIQEKNAM